MILSSWSSCLRLQYARITGDHSHAWFVQCWVSNPGLQAWWANTLSSELYTSPSQQGGTSVLTLKTFSESSQANRDSPGRSGPEGKRFGILVTFTKSFPSNPYVGRLAKVNYQKSHHRTGWDIITVLSTKNSTKIFSDTRRGKKSNSRFGEESSLCVECWPDS